MQSTRGDAPEPRRRVKSREVSGEEEESATTVPKSDLHSDEADSVMSERRQEEQPGCRVHRITGSKHRSEEPPRFHSTHGMKNVLTLPRAGARSRARLTDSFQGTVCPGCCDTRFLFLLAPLQPLRKERPPADPLSPLRRQPSHTLTQNSERVPSC